LLTPGRSSWAANCADDAAIEDVYPGRLELAISEAELISGATVRGIDAAVRPKHQD
jgi:hypothetical protein